uniref:DZF domain-containing protein n=1 Tax=Meloidogyne incognita TaxID=6306 RepID=A0A914KYN4_MELIC
MFGYQQTAYNYPAYASANGQQTANLVGYQQQTGTTGTGTAAAMTQMGNAAAAASGYTYDTSQYSLAASAYAHYSQAAQQQQTATATGSYTGQPTSTDYTGYTATISSGAYGVIGGGKPTTGATKTGAGTGANAVTAHYAGYEAAVYAAASNYLQNKNQARTGGSNWKGGRGGQFGGKKRYGLGHQSRDIQHFFCEVCKISCAGQAAYKDHTDGKPHKKREQAVKEEAMHKRIGFRCEVCEVTCSSKDTFDAHVKGQKHQRTIALLRRMGKPVPQIDLDNIGANLTTKAQGKPIPTVGTSGPLKKVVGVTGTKFVGGTTLLTTGEEYKMGTNAATAVTGAMKPQDLEKALLGDEDVKPVGEEFIEEDKDSLGKFVAYMCKLCDCKFSDINAKNVHLKGRRHRLQYKQKVDPSLKVENKSGWGGRRDGHRRRGQKDDGYYNGHAEFQFMQQPRPILPMPRNQEVMDDKHVIQKLQQIQLSVEEVREVDRLALYVEKTLKAVSDSMINSTELTAEQVEQKRVLKGVMRVGLLAQHLLLKTDKMIDLVVLCSNIPSITLLKKVVELFKKFAELNDTDKLTIQEKINEAAFIINLSTIPFECRVTMTSVVLREGNQPPPQQNEGEKEVAKVEEEAPPIDPLPREACLNALAELRRAKFYQVKCMPLHSMNPTVKAVRDISQRVRTWSPLHNWAITLLVEKTIASISMPLSPGDAVRRIFEVISSGIFLSKRSKLLDPCEKEPVDVLGHITDQEREDITSSAQHALRLIAYNQVYKILGIDRIPDPLPMPETQQLGGGAKTGQKRARAGSFAGGVNEDQNDGYDVVVGLDASATDPVGGKGIHDGEAPNAKKGKVEAVEVMEVGGVVSSK